MIDEWGKGAKYWDHAWNPMIGCKHVSEGCKNCYAERLMVQYPELRDKNGGLSPHSPKNLKKPPKDGVVFVGNMTDLFGEWNSYLEIADWLSMLSDKAVNLILTKRSEHLQEIYLPNFQNNWYGITAENQARLEERIIPFSEATCCHIGRRWLSAEPLLGPLDLERNIQIENEDNEGHGVPIVKVFDWVVVGAESGPDNVRRPCKLEWVESIVEQCQNAGVPVFVKQLDISGKLVKDIEKFPANLQIRQVPWKEGK